MPQYESRAFRQLLESPVFQELLVLLDASQNDEQLQSALRQVAQELAGAAKNDALERKREKMEAASRKAHTRLNVAGIEDYCASRKQGIDRQDALAAFRGCLPSVVDLNLVAELLEDTSSTEGVEVLRALSSEVLTAYGNAATELQARAQEKVAEQMASVMEAANSGQDAAKEAWKAALKLIKEIQKRQAETVVALSQI
jgi:hypothetical protein